MMNVFRKDAHVNLAFLFRQIRRSRPTSRTRRSRRPGPGSGSAADLGPLGRVQGAVTFSASPAAASAATSPTSGASGARTPSTTPPRTRSTRCPPSPGTSGTSVGGRAICAHLHLRHGDPGQHRGAARRRLPPDEPVSLNLTWSPIPRVDIGGESLFGTAPTRTARRASRASSSSAPTSGSRRRDGDVRHRLREPRGPARASRSAARVWTVPEPDAEWQTKSLTRRWTATPPARRPRRDPALPVGSAIGPSPLAPLDRGGDRRERARCRARGLFALWLKKPGEGCFLPEAYRPENRRQRFMGELPHQWVEIHTRCALGEYVERHVKFSDGSPSSSAPSRRATSRSSSTIRGVRPVDRGIRAEPLDQPSTTLSTAGAGVDRAAGSAPWAGHPARDSDSPLDNIIDICSDDIALTRLE